MKHLPPLVGRDRELRQFVTLAGRARPGRPVLLVVDGPPEAGRDRLLAEMAAAGLRLGASVVTGRGCVVVTDRPVEQPGLAEPDRLAAAAGLLVVTTGAPVFDRITADVHRIRLGPLPPGDVRRLVAGLAGARPGDRLLDLVRVAAGRPGAIVRLLDELRAEGLLLVSGGIAGTVAVRLPDATRRRLADRFAALSPSARHVVQAATTLPSPIPPDRLSGLVGRDLIALVPDLEEILDAGIFVSSGASLSFSHDLVRPIVEESMPRAVVAALRDAGRPKPGARRHRRTTAAVDERHRPATDGWSLLSDRELEISELVGQALTNRQIANRLGRSPHTVNYHLRQIFRKLGLASRVELASRLRSRPESGQQDTATAR
ncbi:LuxR C-terminal-related transcriptional regulator [Actinoplanes sp. NPDC049265]|uniref:helix-turn-helix transcriptional regulator n=1 Tax=Actinoplanes sp. NPDC049265 TaxID=3363902 RepID=UPI0037222077